LAANPSPKMHKPCDCALLLALPLTRGEFLADLSVTANKDFAKDFESKLPGIPSEKLWDDHFREEAERMLKSAASVARLGTTVRQSCTAAAFSAALEHHSVAALVAHVINPGLTGKLAPEYDPRELLQQTKVEFADGLVEGTVFERLIPDSFRGILDLRTCNSVILGESIKSIRRSFLVVENIERKFPVVQLIAFQHTIATLSVYDLDYAQASTQARRELFTSV